MQLFVSPGAPSPRRVEMFMVEKGISGIELVNLDLNAQEHKGEAYRAKSPLAKVPALELDDGRVLTETRAICTYLEVAAWFDHVLERQPWIAGERFTIADITAYCAIEFARLMKFHPGKEGMSALQAWRERMAERPSAKLK